jgi:hypothetical protein
VLWEDERQPTCFRLTAPPWPQEGTEGPRWLMRIWMGDHDPVEARLLKPGTRGETRQGSAWHDPGRGELLLPEELKQPCQFSGIRGKQD